MENWKTYFKGKRITMLGLGVLGRGVNVAKFLAERGAILTITDLKSGKQLKSSLDILKKYKNIRYVLGKHRLEDFRKCDLVIKAASVPLESPYVAEARKRRIPVEMDASLFAKFSPATLIGVTGTRGKTTTARMLAAILRQAGRRAYLGGNIRGLATLPLVRKTKKGDVVVLELDSWQLQGFGDSKLSPHIAVFTNFMQDHLNYYLPAGRQVEVGLKKYFADKANIFKYQKKGDVLVASREVVRYIVQNGYRKNLRSRIVVPKALPKHWKLSLLGEHNRGNAALARSAAKELGISDAIIKKTLANFKGVSGRLELVREVGGVKFYNDTTATTPEATIAALRSFKKPILIMGGADKKLEMRKLLAVLPKSAKNVLVLPGTGTDRIKKDLQKIKGVAFVSSLREAVLKAGLIAARGDSVLLSPAFTSFGLFRNEYDRGDQFVTLVKKLGSRR